MKNGKTKTAFDRTPSLEKNCTGLHIRMIRIRLSFSGGPLHPPSSPLRQLPYWLLTQIQRSFSVSIVYLPIRILHAEAFCQDMYFTVGIDVGSIWEGHAVGIEHGRNIDSLYVFPMSYLRLPTSFFLRRKGFALSIYATSLCFMFYPCHPMVFRCRFPMVSEALMGGGWKAGVGMRMSGTGVKLQVSKQAEEKRGVSRWQKVFLKQCHKIPRCAIHAGCCATRLWFPGGVRSVQNFLYQESFITYHHGRPISHVPYKHR